MTDTRSKVLIDAANLTGGGGAQVAVSFLEELSAMTLEESKERRRLARWELHVEASPVVFAALSSDAKSTLAVREVYGRPWSRSRWFPKLRDFDVSFVVFGPEYARRRARSRIVGFADGRSLFGTAVGESSTLLSRARWSLRGVVSRRFMRSADCIIVESSVVREALLRRGISGGGVKIVPNTVHTTFLTQEYKPSRLDDVAASLEEIEILYAARPHPHKNFEFLGELSEALVALGGPRLRFHVTITPDELAGMTPATQKVCVPLGVVDVRQLPELYATADAVIFPSLLESFSVMPLEAMAMGRTVFASDRPFVRLHCGDVPVYIDPLDPKTSARVIQRAIHDPEDLARRAKAGMAFVANIPTARDRAIDYVDAIEELLRSEGG